MIHDIDALPYIQSLANYACIHDIRSVAIVLCQTNVVCLNFLSCHGSMIAAMAMTITVTMIGGNVITLNFIE